VTVAAETEVGRNFLPKGGSDPIARQMRHERTLLASTIFPSLNRHTGGLDGDARQAVYGKPVHDDRSEERT
jgi:hypothetical protein